MTGVTAEYNPFHKGHQYQIGKIREKWPRDPIIALMGGDFTQRGEPAIMDKFTRTKIALTGGADLVIELPSVYAVSGADDFGLGAVKILKGLGTVKRMVFGAEDPDRDFLEAISGKKWESEKFNSDLRTNLKAGLTYPKAYSKSFSGNGMEEYAKAVKKPNNILALSYMRAAKRLSCDMEMIPMERVGEGYIQGASRIREAVFSGGLSKGLGLLPGFSYEEMEKFGKERAFLSMDDFSHYLGSFFLENGKEGILRFTGGNKDLANRIYRYSKDFTGASSLAGYVKNKSVTYARISRIFVRMILGLDDDTLKLAKDDDFFPYARILGVRKEKRYLIGELISSSKIPVMAGTADIIKQRLNNGQRLLLEKDLHAHALYRQALMIRGRCRIPGEFEEGLVVV